MEPTREQWYQRRIAELEAQVRQRDERIEEHRSEAYRCRRCGRTAHAPLPPANNLAEQAIRFVVIDRHVTQGTRSEAGRRWCERIWTVPATCAQQGRSAFDFLHAALSASFHHQPLPVLLRNTS